MTIEDRISGALLGLAAGDALGATVEFTSPAQIQARYGVHRDIIGGGAFRWRPGQGTDDSDMAVAILRAYLGSYSLEAVGENFLRWYHGRPRDIGGTTRTALANLDRSGNPLSSGLSDDRSAGNGSLMRCLPTGLVRADAATRQEEARLISAITHAEPRCVHSCVIYCDVVAFLLEGASPAEAIKRSFGESPVQAGIWDELFYVDSSDVSDEEQLAEFAAIPVEQIPTSGYVIDTLRAGLWAILQAGSAEETLIVIVNRGDDADTAGAVVGGLLGARDGVGAWPDRWLSTLEYRQEFEAAVPAIVELRESVAAAR